MKLTTIPDELELTEAMVEYAKKQGLLDPEDEFERFKNHHGAKGARYQDWSGRVWQNWCRKAKGYQEGAGLKEFRKIQSVCTGDDTKDFEEIITPLMEFYNKRLTGKQIKHWWELTKHVDPRDAEEAVRAIRLNEPWFPTPGKFLAYTDQSRARRSQIEKYRDNEQAKAFFDPDKAPDEVGRDHRTIISKMLTKPAGRERTDYLRRAYERLGEKYPDLDYSSQVKKYENELRNYQ